MNQYDSKILELLKKRRTVLELETLSKRYPSQVAQSITHLKNKGYMIKKILESGGLKYTLVKQNNQISDKQEVAITKISKQFKILVISDTHIGGIYEEPDKWKMAYDYAEENKIPYVLHLGDIIEGSKYRNHKNDHLKTVQEQIDYMTAIYPKRKNVTTLLILGNHDQHSHAQSVNIAVPIERRRLDMMVLGDNTALLKIKNLKVLLNHTDTNPPHKSIEERMEYNHNLLVTKYSGIDLILNGHFHVSRVYLHKNGAPIIYLSSLCQKKEKKNEKNKTIESMNELTFFSNGSQNNDLNVVRIKSILLTPELKVVSETEIPLEKKLQQDKIVTLKKNSKKEIIARAYQDAGCDYYYQNNECYKKFFIEKHTYNEYEIYRNSYDEMFENLKSHEDDHSKVIKK